MRAVGPPRPSARSGRATPTSSSALSLSSCAPWDMDRPGALPILRSFGKTQDRLRSGQALRQGSGQVFSPSRISTYESCPRQYKYRYVDRIPREEESIEAFLGSRVHEALNKLYRDLQLGKAPSLPGLLAYYEWDWVRRWHDQVKIVKQDFSIEHYKGIG